MLQTGLDEWASMPTSRKIAAAVAEIILPSWFSAEGCTGLLLKAITQFFLWVIVPLPLFLPAAILGPRAQPIAFTVAAIISPFVYPSLLAIRLARLIGGSQAYTNRGEIPTWGRLAAEGAVPGRYQDKRYRTLLRSLALVLTFLFFLSIAVGVGRHSRVIESLLGIVLATFYVGGAVVAAELMRCLGHSKRGAYGLAIVTLFFAPIALPAIALFARHRVAGLISTFKRSSAYLQSGKMEEFSTHVKILEETRQALGAARSPTALEPFLRALKDQDVEVRQIAASALGEIGNRKAVVPLIGALKDRNREVRSSAATALGKLGDVQAVEPLTAALTDEDEAVRRAAAQALEAIGGKVEA